MPKPARDKASIAQFSPEAIRLKPANLRREMSGGAKDETQLDDETKVLTLNASEIVKFGLGRQCLQDPEIPAMLGLEGREQQILEATMDCTRKQIEKILDKYGRDGEAASPELEPLLKRP